jgi:hypothetical protein
MKAIFSFAAVALVCLATVAFAKEYRMISGPDTPAAHGVVDAETDRNGNTAFEVKVKHLASPDKLTPARQAYIVWIQARGRDPENQGALRVNEDLEGSAKGRTPYQSFEVFVTAEDAPNPSHPTGPEVLRATVER